MPPVLCTAIILGANRVEERPSPGYVWLYDLFELAVFDHLNRRVQVLSIYANS